MNRRNHVRVSGLFYLVLILPVLLFSAPITLMAGVPHHVLQAAKGSHVTLTLRGDRTVSGTLLSAEGHTVVIRLDDGKMQGVRRGDIQVLQNDGRVETRQNGPRHQQGRTEPSMRGDRAASERDESHRQRKPSQSSAPGVPVQQAFSTETASGTPSAKAGADLKPDDGRQVEILLHDGRFLRGLPGGRANGSLSLHLENGETLQIPESDIKRLTLIFPDPPKPEVNPDDGADPDPIAGFSFGIAGHFPSAGMTLDIRVFMFRAFVSGSPGFGLLGLSRDPAGELSVPLGLGLGITGPVVRRKGFVLMLDGFISGTLIFGKSPFLDRENAMSLGVGVGLSFVFNNRFVIGVRLPFLGYGFNMGSLDGYLGYLISSAAALPALSVGFQF